MEKIGAPAMGAGVPLPVEALGVEAMVAGEEARVAEADAARVEAGEVTVARALVEDARVARVTELVVERALDPAAIGVVLVFGSPCSTRCSR